MTQSGKRLPKKSLGQHFLVNRDLCARIVGLLQPGPDDNIMEIGPGPGALSSILEDLPHSLLLYLEKDLYWAKQRASQAHGKSFAIGIDALAFDWTRLKRSWKIIGNLPYNVASPLIWDIAAGVTNLIRAVFMVQLEVAQRIAATPSTAAYGALSVWVQSHLVPRLEIRIAPGSFRPPPKVDSAVLSFAPAREKPLYPLQLRNLLHICFQNRRKQLGGIFKKSRMDFMLQALEEQHIDRRLRPENLTPAQFNELARWLAPISQ